MRERERERESSSFSTMLLAVIEVCTVRSGVAENGPQRSSRRKSDFTDARRLKIMTMIHGCVTTDGPFLIHEFASITPFMFPCVSNFGLYT